MTPEQKRLRSDLNYIIKTTPKHALTLPLMQYVEKKYYPKTRRDERPLPQHTLDHDVIIDMVCEFYSADKKVLAKKGRKREVVHVRKVCMYLLRNHTRLSLESIGKLFGGQDHTTVIYAVDNLLDLMDAYPNIRQDVEELNDRLLNNQKTSI